MTKPQDTVTIIPKVTKNYVHTRAYNELFRRRWLLFITPIVGLILTACFLREHNTAVCFLLGAALAYAISVFFWLDIKSRKFWNMVKREQEPVDIEALLEVFK